YLEDDGQELTHLSFSSNGEMLVYVRGGDHGSNRPGDAPPNPAGSPIQPKMQVWSVPVAGGQPALLGDGDDPVIAPDSNRVAFVRQPGVGGAPRSPLVQAPLPWAILIARPDATERDLRATPTAITAVTSGNAPVDPILRNPGGLGLWWAADDHLVFLSYRDGWPHLYSLRHPAEGGRPTLLTPGSFMVEQVRVTPDRRFVIFNATAGPHRG